MELVHGKCVKHMVASLLQESLCQLCNVSAEIYFGRLVDMDDVIGIDHVIVIAEYFDMVWQ